MKSLSIKRAFYRDVTSTPHFMIELCYVEHKISFEDIYFDNLSSIPSKLQTLASTRKGMVLLDGGFRIKLWFKVTPSGNAELSFRTEQSEPSFPGRCILEGTFLIEGEMVQEVVNSFKSLFRNGVSVLIEGFD